MIKITLEFIVKHGLVESFKDRLIAIVSDTDNVGWGFHEELVDLYYFSLWQWN